MSKYYDAKSYSKGFADESKIKKKYYKKPKLSLMKLSKEISELKKGVEKKYLQFVSSSAVQVGTSGVIDSEILPEITQGVTADSRLGDEIMPVYIQLEWVANIVNTTLQGVGSIDIILDRKPLSTAPTLLDIFGNSTAPPFFLPFKAKDKRFKILHHTAFEYDLNTLLSKGMTDRIYLPLKKYGKIKYTANNGTIADFGSGQNNILVVFRSTNTNAGNTSYGRSFNLIFCYTDA